MINLRTRIMINKEEEGLPIGTILNFGHTGAVQTYTLPKGTYKLECWGAQGGPYPTNKEYGGKGGYSVGELTLVGDTAIFIYVGGSGVTQSIGGFNGGGRGSIIQRNGGGASDIRISQDSLYARVIVAGGGGGHGNKSNGQMSSGYYGGGTNGGGSSWKISNVTYYLYGKQTGGGSNSMNQSYSSLNNTLTNSSFGNGAGYVGGTYNSSGGGGGWYGGGATSNTNGGGGGGSGYVYKSSTASNYPSGCLLNSSYYLTNASTFAGNTSFTSPTGESETGHEGNGYVRITKIS